METIPFHIQEIAKVYPILASAANNIAEGDIQEWGGLFVELKLDLPRPGSYTSIHSKITIPINNYMSSELLGGRSTDVDYGEVWVHLGNGYFKQVLKRKI
jgi:hypothetical protein